jgi:Ca2+-binding RTX toxin-like protein
MGTDGANTLNGDTSKANKNDQIYGLAGNDILNGKTGNNELFGNAGDDTLIGGTGLTGFFDGGSGFNTVSYAAATVGVTVDLSTNSGTAGVAKDTIRNVQSVIGSGKIDMITGDDGDNTIEGGGSGDKLTGGNGTDTVSYANAKAAVTVDLGVQNGAAQTGSGDAKGDVLTSFENVVGSKLKDLLKGDATNNVIDGGAGDDTLIGLAGADTLRGGDGIDLASYVASASGVTVSLMTGIGAGGDAQGDMLSGIENITGSAGNDTIEGTSGNNVLAGGLGIDTLSYANAPAGVSVSLAATAAQNTGGAGKDAVTGFENLTGSAFEDTLTGDKNANVIQGGDGNDVIQGGAGADILDGGDDDERDPGFPPEADTVSYASSPLGVFIDLNLQEDALAQALFFSGAIANGDASGDVLTGFENIIGSAKADKLIGDQFDNVIEGGAGADILDGGDPTDKETFSFPEFIGDTLSYASSAGAVTVNLATNAVSGGDAKGDVISNFENVTGGKGADRLTGNDKDNVFIGGLGADTITGGGGADVFVYRSLAEKGDTIIDFDGGTIVIHAAGFSGLVAGQDLEDGVSFISEIETGMPRALVNVATFLFDQDNGKLYFDVDGSGKGAAVHLLTIAGPEPLLEASSLLIV